MKDSLKYACQHCGKEVSISTHRGYLRAPGPIKMGRTLMEQFVCETCQQAILSALGGLFEGSSTSDPTRCNMCLGTFEAGGVHYAHRRPLITGIWQTMPICKKCFDTYYECCKNAVRR
jgi:hypothetical protein